MRNISVGGKFLILSGAVVLAFAAIVAVSLWGMNQVRIGGARYGEVAKNWRAADELALLKDDLSELQVLLVMMSGRLSADRLQQLDEECRQAFKRIDQRFQEQLTAGYAPDVVRGIAAAQATWEAFRTTTQANVIPAIQSHDAATVQRLLGGVQRRRYQRFSTQLQGALDVIALRIEQVEHGASSSAATNVLLTTLASVVIGLLLIGFAVLIGRSIAVPLGVLTRAADRVAQGELVQLDRINQSDEVGRLARAFNEMLALLTGTTRRAQQSSRALSQASEALQATNQRVAQGAQAQSDKLSRAAADMHRTTMALEEVRASATTTASYAAAADVAAERGAELVKATDEHLQAIQRAAVQAEQKTSALAQTSRQIGSIVEVLIDIARETHVLAINAQLEAARAGTSGAGFVLIARQVRSLAARSATSATDIQHLVEETQHAIREVQSSTEVTGAAATAGNASSTELQASFREITTRARQTHAAIAEITSVVRSQVDEVIRANALIESVEDVAKETLGATVAILEETQQLNGIVSSLGTELERLRVAA